MDRRGFIQSVLGAAAMAALPASGDGVALKSIKHPILLHDAAHHDLTGGFGLAVAKPEGGTILYDPGLKAYFPKALLKDGLTKQFSDIYEDLRPESFEELWVEIDDED